MSVREVSSIFCATVLRCSGSLVKGRVVEIFNDSAGGGVDCGIQRKTDIKHEECVTKRGKMKHVVSILILF